MRHSLQFHWRNQGYETFSDYLEALSGKRRRQILRERRQLEVKGWRSYTSQETHSSPNTPH